jgi:hypothetical protein
MTRLLGFIALLLGSALLLWVGCAVAMELPIVHKQTPLKPMLLAVVLISGGIGWLSRADDEAELNA